MITIKNFNTSDENPVDIKLFGKISEPKIIKQGYTANRTIGNRFKQRWINTYKATTVEIMAIDEENKNKLEDLFYTTTMVEIRDDAANIIAYGYISGNALGLEYFFDEDENKYWRGGIELEE